MFTYTSLTMRGRKLITNCNSCPRLFGGLMNGWIISILIEKVFDRDKGGWFGLDMSEEKSDNYTCAWIGNLSGTMSSKSIHSNCSFPSSNMRAWLRWSCCSSDVDDWFSAVLSEVVLEYSHTHPFPIMVFKESPIDSSCSDFIAILSW